MRLGLILGEVGSGLRRNLSMVVSVVLVTFISLTFVGASILLQMQIGQMKGYWNDRAQVIVYLCTDIDTTGNCTLTEATDDQIDAVKQQLDSATLAPYINAVQFENHEEAYANFQEQFADTAFDGIIKPESLPENFRVNLVDPEQADVLIESLSGLAGVESVEDQRAYLNPIFAILNAASFTAIGVAALMLVAAVLLIATTIRLSAFSRRRELGIMRLVGASNRFIQTPFILEGVFSALIGSVLAAGTIVAIVHFFVRGYLGSTLPLGTSLLGMQEALLVVPVLIGVGAGLAALSAGVAISRYLKV
ncbi:cell division protein [marine actinobacterium PHSC20C1]|nr:cell division protein [marine actinobacterium PHSC20C1]